MAIPKNVWTLLIFITCGLLMGSVVNALLVGKVPHSFTNSVSVGIDPPFTMDLSFFRMDFGFLFQLNFLSLLGMLLSILLFKKV